MAIPQAEMYGLKNWVILHKGAVVRYNPTTMHQKPKEKGNWRNWGIHVPKYSSDKRRKLLFGFYSSVHELLDDAMSVIKQGHSMTDVRQPDGSRCAPLNPGLYYRF